MVDRVSVTRTTRQLIAEARAREDAFAEVSGLLAKATGTAHDVDETVEVTVDGRGKLRKLWLAPAALDHGHERLGALIVEVAQVAMREATQNGYNKVALLLGEDMTYLVERLSGMPAPARAENDDPGMTVEEFQRLRELRVGGTPAGDVNQPDAFEHEDDDWESFDPASLRSDR